MSRTLAASINLQAMQDSLPDNSAVKVLTVKQVAGLAGDFKVAVREVEICALEQGIVPRRYLRNFKTFDHGDQIRLLKSKAVVVGLGGLGGTVAEILSRLGVGSLILVDGDIFEDHNLNRQLISSHANLGISKAQEAAARVKMANQAVDVEVFNDFFKPEAADRILMAADVVIDCLDAIDTRFMLEKEAKERGIPMVSAAVAGLSGHVTTVFPQDTGLRLIYGAPERLAANKGSETSLGCLAPAVSLLACIETVEVSKVLLGKNGLLRNKLLLVDLDGYTFQILDLI